VSISLEWLTLSQVGLLYDTVGAAVLAWKSIFIGTKEFRNASLFWRQEADTKDLIITKIDSIFGFGLLIVGFILQFMSSFVPSRYPFTIIFSVTLIVLCCGYITAKPYLANWYYAKVSKKHPAP